MRFFRFFNWPSSWDSPGGTGGAKNSTASGAGKGVVVRRHPAPPVGPCVLGRWLLLNTARYSRKVGVKGGGGSFNPHNPLYKMNMNSSRGENCSGAKNYQQGHCRQGHHQVDGVDYATTFGCRSSYIISGAAMAMFF